MAKLNPGILWFIGRPCSGKTTLAQAVRQELLRLGRNCIWLDGDRFRAHVSNDLDYSLEARSENLRRAAGVSNLLAEQNQLVLTTFVTATAAMRQLVRDLIPQVYFCYTRAGFETCKARDVKGMYRKAAGGGIANFTGISSPFEEPSDAHLVVDTEQALPAEGVDQVLKFLEAQGLLER